MKKLILMCSMILGFASLSHAQNYPQANLTPEDRANMATSRLSKQLSLTADQEKQVKAIMLGQAKTMDSLRANGSTDMSVMQASRKAVMENTDAKINTLLTDDQKKIYAEIKAQRMNRQRPTQN